MPKEEISKPLFPVLKYIKDEIDVLEAEAMNFPSFASIDGTLWHLVIGRCKDFGWSCFFKLSFFLKKNNNKQNKTFFSTPTKSKLYIYIHANTECESFSALCRESCGEMSVIATTFLFLMLPVIKKETKNSSSTHTDCKTQVQSWIFFYPLSDLWRHFQCFQRSS